MLPFLTLCPRWNMTYKVLSIAKCHNTIRSLHHKRLFSQASTLPRSAVTGNEQENSSAPLGHLARRKEEDKQFFADLLSSAATKRDAKAYLARLKNDNFKPSKTLNLFGRSTAVETSPVFQQSGTTQVPVPEQEAPHIAVVKISNLKDITDDVLRGIAGTLAQLARLSMLPCVVVDGPTNDKQILIEQVDRLVSALDAVSESGARKVSDVFTLDKDGRAVLSMPSILLRPLHRGRIPVLVPIAYDEKTQKTVRVTGDEAVIALTKHMTSGTESPIALLDRIIVIDDSGGIPSTKSIDQMHVFVNTEQEYHALQEELRSSTDSRVHPSHASNLSMLRRALRLLPPTASGLITTPSEAANTMRSSTPISTVGTRRRRNPLIHNLLTDKPAYSSSLPSTRLSTTSPTLTTSTTFIKRGMPLTILPNPAAQTWSPTAGPRPTLANNPHLSLPRLTALINDSFHRELDVAAYLARVDTRIAGVIIAGDYDGAAILTWESPPHAPHRFVPYLDKFAVASKSQGAGGVADILFNAMVRTCLPQGVCWRSRRGNPVNKWYFERSRGTWKIPGGEWTMFWTTEDVVGGDVGDERFLDYEAVCRGVVPTWVDGAKE